LASYIGSIDLATNIVAFNFISLLFNIHMGISFSVCTLVGNSIGRKDVKKAKKYAIVALLSGFLILSIVTIFIVLFRYEIPLMYTGLAEINVLFARTLSIFSIYCLIDCVQNILNGIIKGLGKQRLASIIAILVLYPVNIPLAYTLAFTVNYGFIGLWISQLNSIILLTIGYTIIIICLDWKHVAKRANESIQITKKYHTIRFII